MAGFSFIDGGLDDIFFNCIFFIFYVLIALPTIVI